MLPILMYHSVRSPETIVSISPENFYFQMRWLHEKGFQTVTVRQLTNILRSGGPIPGKAIAITFDDGYECLYDLAWPVLRKFGFNATVFLVSGAIGKTNDWDLHNNQIAPQPLLNWGQISEMDQSGIEFGSHTITHPRLDRLNPETLEREISASKLQLEQGLGHPVESFAYPYGWYNQAVIESVKRHYAAACSTRLGLVGQDSDLYQLNRFEMYYLRNFRFFRLLEHPLIRPYISIRRVLHEAGGFLFHRDWR